MNSFSALQRAEIAEIHADRRRMSDDPAVSVLFNEPKLLKLIWKPRRSAVSDVSVLFNEPKLLKSSRQSPKREPRQSFSALQRAEIAEITSYTNYQPPTPRCFSALQRAEIAEMSSAPARAWRCVSFSALQRAEIAEMIPCVAGHPARCAFQCSSTSRNC